MIAVGSMYLWGDFHLTPETEPWVCPCPLQWKTNKTTLLENSQRVTNALLARSEINMGDRQLPPSAAIMNSRCFQQLDEGYDEEYGGFAEAPKFPTPGQCPLTCKPPPVCDP